MARYKLLQIAGLFLAGLAFTAATTKADTTYTYTGNPYNFCDGTYVCTGTSPAMQITFDVASGTVLNNLSLTDISADITSFSITDGQSAPLTILQGPPNGVEIGTDASGNIISWSITDSDLAFTPFLRIRSFFSGNLPGMSGDISTIFISNGQSFMSGDGGAFPLGTWTATGVPEPSSVPLLGIGILALTGLKFKRGRQTPDGVSL